jgi:hypothetical protein
MEIDNLHISEVLTGVLFSMAFYSNTVFIQIPCALFYSFCVKDTNMHIQGSEMVQSTMCVCVCVRARSRARACVLCSCRRGNIV